MPEPDHRTVVPIGSDPHEVAYRRHADELVRYATVLVGPDDAQDVVAAALMRVFGRRRPVDAVRAYLYRAVSNEAKNWKRSAARRGVREATQFQPEAAVQPLPRPDVRAAIEDLSVRQRAVVYLTYWEDMTDTMVAEHLGISPGSVRRHLGRARDKLREVLDE
jgi:RNA polymerase sigma-70 factor (ECF subfamily)